MLIHTQTTLALRCTNCGNLVFHTLSRFVLGKSKQSRYTCECGTCLATMGYKGKGNIYLQVECMLCDNKHISKYKAPYMWNTRIKTILCDESGLEIGFIGPREQVRECVQRLDRSMRELSEDMGYDKYFLNPEIMYKALEWLKKMTEEGKVYCSCEAGELDVEAYPDRVELYCTNCEAVGVIPAETKEDLNWINKASGFMLEAHKYCSFNHKSSNKRGRFNRKNT